MKYLGNVWMMGYGLTMRTRVAGRRHLRGALTLAMAGALLLGCGGGSSFGDDSSWFGELFGGRGEAPPPPVDHELLCPPVRIRPGASTFAVGLPGKQASGADLRYQATISRTARDCTQTGDQITARIGIQGRVISGPAGSPATVEVPIRVAVVEGGVQERTIATKVYRTTVSMSAAGNEPFSLVAEDIVYPVPSAATVDSYIFYIGFDPQALTPEPRAARRKKK
ncbi:MAG TPA: hypothetical protein VF396_23960 [Bradyrhizobium sp.]|jgi:hypothetical protein